MNIESMLNLIKEIKDDFIYSSLRRKETSTSNKWYHNEAISFVQSENWLEFKRLLENQQYQKILPGVVACLPEDCKFKSELFEQVRN